MLRNYIKIAWRNLMRRKGYTVINIAGLTVGIAACLLIFIVVQFELSFNKQNKNYDSIYHITTISKHGNETIYNPGVPVPTVDALRLNFPDTKFAAFNINYNTQISLPDSKGVADKKFIQEIGAVFIEPQYFDLFDAEWLAGNLSVLTQPNTVVLDKTTAAKYFGDWKNAVGKIIKMDNWVTMKVAGIIQDFPANSDFPFKVLISYITWKNVGSYNYNNDWGNNSSNHQVFMLMPKDVNEAKMTAQLKVFRDKYDTENKSHDKSFLIQPLSETHFDTRFGNSTSDHITTRATIRTLTFIAVLIIVMASINFINLTTAQSVNRSKEVGIRKVLGSSRGQLIGQIIGETAIIVIAAAIFGVVLAKVALPYLENVAYVPKTIELISAGNITFIIATVIAVVLLSGTYPALVLSGFKPVLAIKNKITAASVGGVPLRRGLVVAQFAISQLLIIGTLVAIKQMAFVNSVDLGFSKEAVLVVPGYTDSISLAKMDNFKQQLLQRNDVVAVSFASDQPSSDNNWGNNFYFNNSATDVDFTAYVKVADNDYFKTYGLKFVAGKAYAQSDTIREIVVNETMVAKLGIKKPADIIGKTFRFGNMQNWVQIVGVVKDFKTNSLREEVRPIAIYPKKADEAIAGIKIQTGNLTKTVAAIKSMWEDTYPEYAYNGFFLDESIAQFYAQENQLALIYKIFAGIAIFISCLGLYGLVSFMAVQRTKEVGIRKVLGASVGSIIYLFSKEFILLLFVSFIIAMPAAWYLMGQWLQNFAYRIDMGPGVFILAIALSVIVAFLTFGYKAISTALVNPVKSLRSE